MQERDSTYGRWSWHEEDGIIAPRGEEHHVPKAVQAQMNVKKTQPMPVKKEIPKAKVGVPRFLAYPYFSAAETKDSVAGRIGSLPGQHVATTQVVTLNPVDSAARAADSIKHIPGQELKGIVLIDPAAAYIKREAVPHPTSTWWGSGMSWIYLALALLFCIIGVRFKSSKRYLGALMSDLTETRVRHNAFDDTVRETSLLVLLNILWAACAGVFLWICVRLFSPSLPQWSFSIPDKPAGGIGICMGVAACYLILINIAYWMVGNVFSDARRTSLWLKGAGASTGLQTFILFPLALLAMAYPAWQWQMLILAAILFIIGKIVFLYKGFRIFFSQISSWLLFLYYLCSLEIVPLILTYGAALLCCSSWL